LDRPSWSTDYRSAQNLGNEEGKPLAVFIGSGTAGWEHLSREGKLDEQANRILASRYVCVYVDTSNDSGKQLAADFDVDHPALVISDRTGRLQAFRHEGDLQGEDLVRYLKRYAEPERVVRTTETTAVTRTSRYSDSFAPLPSQNYFQPIYYSPSFSFGG